MPQPHGNRLSLLIAACAIGAMPASAGAQSSQDADRIAKLSEAVSRAEAQIEASQRELEALKQQLAAMRADMAASAAADADTKQHDAEQRALEQTQVATLDRAKVESASKYSLRLSGTLLLNGFVNTGRVDEVSNPTSVLANSGGSTGLSVRQTVLGLDAQGPHLFGAASHADVRVDFFGAPSTSSTQGYVNADQLLRLRTAHATLDWRRTRLFFALDRPLLNPNLPESLVAAATPELSWSGNLWRWNPQLGITQTLGTRTRLVMEAALIDASDPAPLLSVVPASAAASNLSEASRYPGTEARIAVQRGEPAHIASFGVGGYFAPHFLATGFGGRGSSFDAWAGTVDFRLPLPHNLVLSGNAYRGAALGGLGGGGYKDYVYRFTGSALELRALDDVGGWVQVHGLINQRLSWNTGLGIDNAFAKQMRSYPGNGTGDVYGNIARNRTVFANVIYSPSAYLLFSVEYRYLYTAPVGAPLWTSNSTGVGAAYRF